MESSKSSEIMHIDFRNWKNKIEDNMLRTIGIKPDDLPDYMYWDAFSRNETVQNTMNDYFKKNNNHSLYYYWLNYIKSIYIKNTGNQLKYDNVKYKMLFKNKHSCYNVVDSLIYSLNNKKIKYVN